MAVKKDPKRSVKKSIHMLLAVLLTAVTLALSPSTAIADQQPMFGRMFPHLPAYDAPDDDALTALTCGQTPTSAICTAQTRVPSLSGPEMGPLFDQNVAAPTNPNDDNPDNVPSFFTYFGRFLDHDMTLDLLPLPTEFVDPETIPNNRDPRLNLDSVYGGGPHVNPELYEADKKHFKVNGRDLPRNPDGSAIINEGRNDENQVIAQIHVAFLRAHNRLIDEGYSFQKAREL